MWPIIRHFGGFNSRLLLIISLQIKFFLAILRQWNINKLNIWITRGTSQTTPAWILKGGMRTNLTNIFYCENQIPNWSNFFGNSIISIEGRTLKGREKANFVLTSNADWELSCEAINLKPIPATDPRTQLSGGVSYTFVLWVHEVPNQINYRESKSVFSVSSYLLVLR